MIQGGQRLRFTLETRESLGIVRERLRQDFDRDITIELRVAGSIDFTHASATKQINQLEDA
jgi:hypothetical protein